MFCRWTESVLRADEACGTAREVIGVTEGVLFTQMEKAGGGLSPGVTTRDDDGKEERLRVTKGEGVPDERVVTDGLAGRELTHTRAFVRRRGGAFTALKVDGDGTRPA